MPLIFLDFHTLFMAFSVFLSSPWVFVSICFGCTTGLLCRSTCCCLFSSDSDASYLSLSQSAPHHYPLRRSSPGHRTFLDHETLKAKKIKEQKKTCNIRKKRPRHFSFSLSSGAARHGTLWRRTGQAEQTKPNPLACQPKRLVLPLLYLYWNFPCTASFFFFFSSLLLTLSPSFVFSFFLFSPCDTRAAELIRNMTLIAFVCSPLS